MKTEAATWVATAVGSPLIIVVLCWTLVIYHDHRRHWQPVDLLVAAVVGQGVAKQAATFCYAVLTLLRPLGGQQPLCSAVSWLLNSLHFLQAATLATLAASRMLAVRRPLRYRQLARRTHVTYHVISLAALAACLGAAAVLAETRPGAASWQGGNLTAAHRVYCVFLPHELDARYAVLSVAVHALLGLATAAALAVTAVGWCLARGQRARVPASREAQLLKSDASVMSDSSLGSAKQDDEKARARGDQQPAGDSAARRLARGPSLEEMYDHIYALRWATESSCISSSTSSTNSRAPCLARHQAAARGAASVQWEELRMCTAVAVLGLCYIFNHVPALILSVVGTFVSQLLPPNWPLHLVFFWTGMAEECLLPVVLALFDDNFSGWVHATYTSDRRLLVDLARHHQGLDGKFRIFNPPLADVQPHQKLHHSQQQMKFPITNGSLFTTVCGRHPVIHNYRRGTRLPVTVPSQCAGSGVGTPEQFLLQNAPGIIQHPAAAGSQTSFTDESRKLLGDYRNFQLFQGLPGSGEGQDEKNSPNMTLSELQLKHSSLGCEEDLNSELASFGDVNEPIYATLSSRSCCSATTAANDDFEFYQHETNPSGCCKSNELYFSDGNVSNILERENKRSEESSSCSLMNEKSFGAEFDNVEKLMPQFLYDGLFHVCGKNSSHGDLVVAPIKEPNVIRNEKLITDGSLLGAIENEIKNRCKEMKLNTSLIGETSEQHRSHNQLDLPTTVTCDTSVTETKNIGNCGYCDLQKDKNEQKRVLREKGKKSDTLSPYSHRRYISKGFLKSLSVDNFDELNEELNYHKANDVTDWGNKWCPEYKRQYSVNEFNAMDRKEMPRHIISGKRKGGVGVT
ncbi:uncharacterized protein LOC134529220 isoform X2 [Bacillus rossius redtenbacheri]|uniref:uncharacterized protein LOC134529220 isoform X2 n=1 Tax=Bacillus rossius redtenbacheri TaxID=93214 RepID=UPI002FDE3A58